MKGFLSDVNAKVKIVLAFAFILSLSLMPNGSWPAYVLAYSLLLSIVVVYKLDYRQLFKKTAVSVFFSLAALPLVFTGAPPKQDLLTFNTITISISSPGTVRFISIVIKAWLSFQAAVILTSTTPTVKLMQGFRDIKVPAVIIAIMNLMVRYLRVLQADVYKMILARNSRSTRISKFNIATALKNYTYRALTTGKMAGNILLRSLDRSDKIYYAMLARGYDGSLPEYPPRPTQTAEYFTLAGGIILILCLFFLSLL